MSFEHWRQDLRVAARRLGRSPGFAASAVLTLALGIGSTTAVWTAVKGVLLDALPFEQPERLMMITRSGDVSILDGVDWRPATPALESLALFLPRWEVDLIGQGEPVRLRAAVVEPEIFRVLRVPALVGRALVEADDRVGAPRTAVLSERAWRARFGAAADVLGRTVILSGEPTTIVGVMPARADFLGADWDVYLPVAVGAPAMLGERGTNNFDAIGRLAAGATLAGANRELLAVCERLAREYPQTNQGKLVEAMPLLDFLVGPVRRSLWLLLAGVALLMVLASLAVGSMLIARALGRQREVVVRLALGSPRSSIVRMLMVESGLLAAAGAIGGAVLAWAAVPLLLHNAALPPARTAAIGVDPSVLLFGVACALLCALVFGPLPVVHLLRRTGARSLAPGARSTGGRDRRLVQSGLVTIQVGIACALLASALLLGRSFRQLRAVDLGFQPDGVLAADLVLPESRYAEPAAQTRAFKAIVERLAALPGVTAAGSIVGPPLEPRGGIGSAITVEGYTPPADQRLGARSRLVQGDGLAALGVRVVDGRGFEPRDRAGAPSVALVNRTFARRYLAGREPLGARIARLHWSPEPEWLTVIGVVDDLKGTTLRAGDDAVIYTPYEQRTATWQRWGTLLVRAEGRPRALERSLREAVWAVDPELTVQLYTLRERVDAASAADRFYAFALSAFGAAALLLAFQGLYGLLAQIVSDRRREFGVRAALGAAPRLLAATVLGHSLRWIAAGLVIGLALLVAMGGLLRGLLYEVSPLDPRTIAASLAAVALGAVLAAGLPAWRAAGADPAQTLRED